MTFEELNIVRKLKKQIANEEDKLANFRDLAQSITPQFSRETFRDEKNKLQSYTCLNVLPKGNSTESSVEKVATLIVDTERIIDDLKKQLEKEQTLLIKKITENFSDSTEQKILLNHYALGKSFRAIAQNSHYSVRQVLRIHKRLIKNLKKLSHDVTTCHRVSS